MITAPISAWLAGPIRSPMSCIRAQATYSSSRPSRSARVALCSEWASRLTANLPSLVVERPERGQQPVGVGMVGRTPRPAAPMARQSSTGAFRSMAWNVALALVSPLGHGRVLLFKRKPSRHGCGRGRAQGQRAACRGRCAVGIVAAPVREAERGRSSEVERQLPKLNVAGSIPAGRSKIFNVLRCLVDSLRMSIWESFGKFLSGFVPAEKKPPVGISAGAIRLLSVAPTFRVSAPLGRDLTLGQSRPSAVSRVALDLCIEWGCVPSPCRKLATLFCPLGGPLALAR